MSDSVEVNIVFGPREEVRKGRGDFGYTTEQAASHLDLSVARFRQIVEKGDIHPLARLGRLDLFRETEVEAFRKKREK